MYSGVGTSEPSSWSDRPWLQITAPWARSPPSMLAASCVGTSSACIAPVPSGRVAAATTAALHKEITRMARGEWGNIAERL
jgi:hypothetical protein